jgi:hypothetical protein
VPTTLDPPGVPWQSPWQTVTSQTVDQYGNVTQTKIYNYGNLTTPARTFNNTYLNTSNYTSRYILNRLQTSTVSDGVHPTVTLMTNTYDVSAPTNVTGLRQHDDANYGTRSVARLA